MPKPTKKAAAAETSDIMRLDSKAAMVPDDAEMSDADGDMEEMPLSERQGIVYLGQ